MAEQAVEHLRLYDLAMLAFTVRENDNKREGKQKKKELLMDGNCCNPAEEKGSQE